MFGIDPESHGNIYCSITSGINLDPVICDVLLFNAADMIECRRRDQRIKGRNYDGVIRSDLEVIIHPAGFPLVNFDAIVETGKWEAGEVSFFVRTDNLDVIRMNQGRWGKIIAHVMGLPPGMNPMDIIKAMKEGKAFPIPPNMIPPEIREAIERDIENMIDDEDDDDDEPEWDTGEPTYG